MARRLTPAQKLKRQQQKERLKLRVQKRKQKRTERMAPKHRLAEWSKRVMERDGNKCVVSGVGVVNTGRMSKTRKVNPITGKLRKARVVITPLNAHHILPKDKYPQFKFKLINGVTLTPKHHKYDKFSAHKNPIWFSEWLRKNRPLQYKWAVANMGSHNDSGFD